MNHFLIDSHIHLDLYSESERTTLLKTVDKNVKQLISVSYHLESCKENLKISRENKLIKAAFGFHPEQKLPSDSDIETLLSFMSEHDSEMVAIGEVGLPYYLCKENRSIRIDPYIDLLEQMIIFGKKMKKPIILHAVYEHAQIALDLLEKHSVKAAHFHWFKGDSRVMDRMIQNEFFISVTPDVLYEKEIQDIVTYYPLSKMMVETDGPWPFEGPFQEMMTHPNMIHQTIIKIAQLKSISIDECYGILFQNTREFYQL